MPIELTCAIHPSPRPLPDLSPLAVRAAVVREAHTAENWPYTLATFCPQNHADLGLPCWPPSGPGDHGAICVERAFAAARRLFAGVQR